jgi:hypothetical protein
VTTRPTYCNYCHGCGKQSYQTRSIAKQVRKRVPPDGRGPLSAYRCPDDTGYWHLGHLPPLDNARDVLRRKRGKT